MLRHVLPSRPTELELHVQGAISRMRAQLASGLEELERAKRVQSRADEALDVLERIQHHAREEVGPR